MRNGTAFYEGKGSRSDLQVAVSEWENRVTDTESNKMVCGKWTLRKEFCAWLGLSLGFPHTSVGKEPACNAGDLGSIPGSGRSPGERNSTHSRILAWRIPLTREPGRLQSMGLQESDTTEWLSLLLLGLSLK